jgi:hypothetical protein
MIPLNEKCVINQKGELISVVAGMEDCGKCLEELEELASTRAYDASKPTDDVIIAFEQEIDCG